MSEFMSYEPKKESEGLLSKIAEHKRTIGRVFGLIGLLSLAGTKVKQVDGEEKPITTQSLKLAGGPAMPQNLAVEKLNLDTEQEKIQDRLEGYGEITAALDGIAKGEVFDGQFSDKLLMLENTKEELGNDYNAILSTLLEKTATTDSEARTQEFKDGLSYLIDFYNKNAADMSPEEKQAFANESGLALGTFINEYLSQRKAGGMEHSVGVGEKAGLVGDLQKVLAEMEISMDSAKIENGSISAFVDGKNVDLGEGAAYIQTLGQETLQLPLEEANNVEITNLYNLKETDPLKYQQVLDNVLRYNREGLQQQYKEATGIDLNLEELKMKIQQNLEGGDPVSGQKVLENARVFDCDFNIKKLWDMIPMPSVSYKWGDKETNYAMNYDLKVMGGKISSTMLCEGNHVQIISLDSKGSVVSPGKTEVSIPLLILLMPLLGLKKKRQDKEGPSEQEIKSKKDSPIEVPVPPLRTDPEKIEINSQIDPGKTGSSVQESAFTYSSFPETPVPSKINATKIPLEKPGEHELSGLEEISDLQDVNMARVDDGLIISGVKPASSAETFPASETKADTIYVFAQISVDKKTGEISIISTGETTLVEPKPESQFRVGKVEPQ